MAKLEIFDVEHGACALFTADTGSCMMIDCGTNNATGWTPAQELKSRGLYALDQLVVTNYDEDHVNGLPELQEEIYIKNLWRTKNIEPNEIVQLKSQDGMGNGIAELIKMAGKYTAPSDPIDYGNVQSELYFNPPHSFNDENNLSALLVLTIYGHKVLFTGDMERAGFDAILTRHEVRNAVSGASILIAPHHGRECSVHPEFLALANPFWTVISDRGYIYATQETIPSYRQYSKGGSFRGEQRRVLTTRKDGDISFYFNTDSSWGGF